MWKRFEYGNCKKKYIHAWLNWLTMQTKRINIETNAWCYDFKVRYKNQRMLPTGHWLWIFNITISIPKKIYLNKYVDVKKANFTQKPISHSMEKHAASFVLRIFWLLKSIYQACIIPKKVATRNSKISC